MIKTYQSFFVLVKKIFLTIFLGLSFLAISVTNVEAVGSCSGVLSGARGTLPAGTTSHTIEIDMSSGYDPNGEYEIVVSGWWGDAQATSAKFKTTKSGTLTNGSNTLNLKNGKVTWTIKEEGALTHWGISGEEAEHYISIYKNGSKICDAGTYKTSNNNTGGKCALYVSQSRDGQTCYSSGCMDTTSSTTKIEVEGLEDSQGKPFSGEVKFVIKGGSTADEKTKATGGKASASFEADNQTTYKIHVETAEGPKYIFPGCSTSFNTIDYCEDEMCDDIRTDVSENVMVKNFELCEQATAEDRDKCQACFGGETFNGNAGVWTAIGCIPAKPDSIIKTFITVGLSVGGGATFLLILAGAFRLSVSQGDPQATKDAKEQITSAIIGMVFIIFSITMLRFIGVNLFQIPGFGG
ncbi:MAG: hypothetical protein ACOZAK_04710 [Patescibacteria group bacterium]